MATEIIIGTAAGFVGGALVASQTRLLGGIAGAAVGGLAGYLIGQSSKTAVVTPQPVTSAPPVNGAVPPQILTTPVATPATPEEASSIKLALAPGSGWFNCPTAKIRYRGVYSWGKLESGGGGEPVWFLLAEYRGDRDPPFAIDAIERVIKFWWPGVFPKGVWAIGNDCYGHGGMYRVI